MAYYCGLDVGSRKSQLCVLDEEGTEVFQEEVSNVLSLILRALEPFREGLRCVVESTFNWYWLVDGLQDAGIDVILAHTLGLSMITRAKVKTDRRDAHKLAKLLKAGMIPEAYIYPKEERPVRDLVRARGRLVMQRGSCYAALRRLLYQQGLIEHNRNSIKDVSHRTIEKWPVHPMVQFNAYQIVDRVDLYTSQIERTEEWILATVEKKPAFDRLMTIPGIGPILAITIFYEVGDINRFANARHFSSYCRVVPGVAQSSTVTRRGRGSKQGNPYLKWAFTEAAVFARRYYMKVRRHYDRCARRHAGRGQKLVANNTVAHKLCQAAYHVLSKDVNYREELLYGN